MYTILLILGLLCLITGLGLGVAARRHRTPAAPPMPSWNPKHWLPWKMHEWMTPKGLKLHYLSIVLIMIGMVLYLMAEGAPPLVGR